MALVAGSGTEMNPTDGFVSGRSHDRFTPRVVIHDRPIPWDEYVKRTEKRTGIVSHAAQARDEAEAQVKHNETEKKASQKKTRKRTASKFALPDPFHGCDEPYQLDPQVKRMRLAVERIVNRMAQIDSLYETIVKPNRAQRREYDAIMRRMRHEIDTVS